MASAAMRLRAPDRQMKKSSVSLLAPAASSAWVIRSAKPASILLSGDVCHSTVRTLLPISARSGRPTNAHSALVRTSISAEAVSFSSCAQTSSTGTSSMWTTSIDCTFVLHSRRPGWKYVHSGLLTEQPRRQQNNASTCWTIIQKESRNTLRGDDGARDEILYKTWCQLALVRRQLSKPVDSQNRNA
jgi:hypothetical protein